MRNKRLIRRYGRSFGAEVARQHFPSVNREEKYPTLESAVSDDTPTMQLLDRVYGKGTSNYWIDVQLTEIFLFTGLREKVSVNQRNILVGQLRSIAVGYCVTLSEMMVFFSWFERGRYGMFYGYERPNLQIIIKGFEDFLVDLRDCRRVIAEERKRQEDARNAREWAKDAVPMPDYVKQHLLEYGNRQREFMNPPKQLQKIEVMWVVTTSDGKQSEPMPTRQIRQYINDNNIKDYAINRYKG